MQHIKLSIPEPCHESWDNMSPTEKGRYCGSCQKEVVDFTGMTDAELYAFFTQKRSGSVCGRTHVGQLDTPIQKTLPIKKHRLWYLQYAASFLLLLAKPGSGKAQAKPQVTVAPRPTAVLLGDTMIAPMPATPTTIKGEVVDKNGEPIPYASIMVKGTKQGTACDANGQYQIKITEGATLSVYAIGYESKDVALAPGIANLNIEMEKLSVQNDMGVVLAGYTVSEDGFVAYDKPRHKTLLQVRDKQGRTPLPKAHLLIERPNRRRPQQEQANTKGEYLLRRVKEGDAYTVTVTVPGYKPRRITIKGNELVKGNDNRVVLLEKQIMTGSVQMVTATAIRNCPTDIKQALHGKISSPVVATGQPPAPALRPSPVGALHQPLVGGGIAVTLRCAVAPAKARPWADTLKKAKQMVAQLISKKGANNTPAPITLYPNPVHQNGTLAIDFGKTVPGRYMLQLFATGGQLQQQATITVPAENFTFHWQLEAKAAPGSYMLHIGDAKGKQVLSAQTIIVQ
jgi:hypothetical protein